MPVIEHPCGTCGLRANERKTVRAEIEHLRSALLAVVRAAPYDSKVQRIAADALKPHADNGASSG